MLPKCIEELIWDYVLQLKMADHIDRFRLIHKDITSEFAFYHEVLSDHPALFVFFKKWYCTLLATGRSKVRA